MSTNASTSNPPEAGQPSAFCRADPGEVVFSCLHFSLTAPPPSFPITMTGEPIAIVAEHSVDGLELFIWKRLKTDWLLHR